MKSILMSIQPKWCEKIISGEKTIEVRKTAPKQVPFKVYIYCTKEEPNLYIPAEFNCFPLDEASQPYFAKEPFIVEVDNLANGKVIGEFICDKVDTISVHNNTVYSVNNLFADKLKNMCLTVAELKEYLGAKNNGYAIGITDLKVYDKPRELGEFGKYCIDYGKDLPFCNCHCSSECYKAITRPPQSWQYIQELED